MPAPRVAAAASGIPTRLIYSPAETEELLGISHAAIYQLLKDGKLTSVKIGARTGITAQSIAALCGEAVDGE
jgi:predicted DNA-binding transcriptional regulator AlpA